MTIGLTGGYCAGKNAVAAILERRLWTCIDADALGHEAIELARDAIARRFGAGVLANDGRLDRRAIARIVFADPAALAEQEAIVHPIAIRLMEERIARAEDEARAEGREPRICVNAALLHRAGIVARLDAIIEVRAPFLVRLVRGARRDGAGWRSALRRMTRQRGFGAALREAAAGRPILVVRNEGSMVALERGVGAALRELGAAGTAGRPEGKA
jgi:dephospho-CoA kinase